MTGPEHYRRAEQLIEGITSTNEFGIQIAKTRSLSLRLKRTLSSRSPLQPRLTPTAGSGSTSLVPR